jgi:dipeptidyl aminopeptidase/acylaminoacyl peptidase
MRNVLFFGALALVCAASLQAGTPAQAANQNIPIADFAALPVLKSPILSPSGNRIAARQLADGKTRIVILRADEPEKPIRIVDIGEANVVGLKWAGDSRLLLTVMLKGMLNRLELPVLRLSSIEIASGAVKPLDTGSHGAYAGDILYADPSGTWALVSSQDTLHDYPSVKRIDLASGASVVVEKPRTGVWDWYADDQGVVRAGLEIEGRHWTLWYRDLPGEKLRKIQGKVAKDKDSAVDRFIFRGQNSWIVTNERTGRFGLYEYDLKTGQLGKGLFERPDVDLDDVLYDSGTGELKAVKYQDDRWHLKWFDPAIANLQNRLDRALPNSTNLPVDWSNDDNRVLIWSGSAFDPGRYFLLDRKSAKMHAVIDPYPSIDPAKLAPVTAVHYRARDGLDLPAYLTLPRHREARALPLIVMPHGGPYERDDWEYDAVVQFLANRGYAVLQPEFRGSTGYGKDFVSKGDGQWGRKMQDDLDDGVAWLTASGKIDPKRVCIVGASYGGYAAMWGAIRNPEIYRCAASFAGVSDLPAMLRYDRKLFSATRYFKEWRNRVLGEGEDDADLKSVSPINHADRLRVPLFIAHGEKDENVPSEQSHDMVDALNRAHANVTSVFYKEDGHGWDKAEDFADWLQRLEAFLAKYNPA